MGAASYIEQESPSAYVKAYALSANKVLSAYQNKVCILEQEKLTRGDISFSYLAMRLTE